MKDYKPGCIFQLNFECQLVRFWCTEYTCVERESQWERTIEMGEESLYSRVCRSYCMMNCFVFEIINVTLIGDTFEVQFGPVVWRWVCCGDLRVFHFHIFGTERTKWLSPCYSLGSLLIGFPQGEENLSQNYSETGLSFNILRITL